MDINAARFVVGVSVATKIDPRVLVAWVQQEGAYAPNGTGHFNYLNLRNDGINENAKGFDQFSSVNQAIQYTIKRINNNHAIRQTALTKPTPKEQIAAIANSGWDEGHYGGNGGVNLVNTFTGIFSKPALTDAYVGPENAGPVTATAKTGSASDAGSYDAGDAVGDAVGAAKHIPGVEQILSIGDAFRWIGGNWDRIFLVIGGGILVILALVFVAKSQQNSLLETAAKGKG